VFFGDASILSCPFFSFLCVFYSESIILKEDFNLVAGRDASRLALHAAFRPLSSSPFFPHFPASRVLFASGRCGCVQSSPPVGCLARLLGSLSQRGLTHSTNPLFTFYPSTRVCDFGFAFLFPSFRSRRQLLLRPFPLTFLCRPPFFQLLTDNNGPRKAFRTTFFSERCRYF